MQELLKAWDEYYKKAIIDREFESNENEKVNHPSHYQSSSLETIQVIEAFGLGFNLGNAIKYTLRAGKKGDKVEDLQKAIWYLKREIENESKDG